MTKQILTVSTLLVAALALGTTGCKKKDKKQDTPAAAGHDNNAEKAGHQADAHPAGEQKKEEAAPKKVELTGTPAEKLTQVLNITVDRLSSVKTAPEAVAALKGVMSDYNIASLREEAAKAKAAGQGASEAAKQKFKAAKDKYKEVITKLGSEHAAIVGPVAAEFAKQFGIS